MKKYFILLMLLPLFFASCTWGDGIIMNPQPGKASPINWETLGPIIYDMASSERIANNAWLNEKVGKQNMQIAGKVLDAIGLGLKVYQSLQSGKSSRDLRVAEAISRYKQEIS